jgi:hypothetical protein
MNIIVQPPLEVNTFLDLTLPFSALFWEETSEQSAA